MRPPCYVYQYWAAPRPASGAGAPEADPVWGPWGYLYASQHVRDALARAGVPCVNGVVGGVDAAWYPDWVCAFVHRDWTRAAHVARLLQRHGPVSLSGVAALGGNEALLALSMAAP